MPSYENVPAPYEPPVKEPEVLSTTKLPAYEPLPPLAPDQATELLKSHRYIDVLNDVDEILKALPDDMHGKKDALRSLIAATGNLITAYRFEQPDTGTSKTFALGGLNDLRDALRGFGFKADEVQETINRVYGK